MPRPGLDRRAVVEAAARMADAEGLESVSLAGLAAEVGVKPPSLYNHIDGQEGLRRELALHGMRAMSRVLGREAIGKAGDNALWAIAEAYRDFAREHPGLYAATVRAPGPDDTELVAAAAEVVDIVLAVLEGYGFRGKQAVHIARGLRALIHGFISLEAAGGFGMPVEVDESFRLSIGAFVASLNRAAS